MRFSTVFAATAIAGTALATDHVVAVSNKAGNLTFNPDSLEAAQGDTVTFKYWPKAHSVVQSAFASPCTPMDSGIWSGFVMTNDTNAVSPTTFQVTVSNASTPIWLYCSQGKHCQSGMVMVINQAKTGNKTLDAYKAAAKLATDNKSPSSTKAIGGTLSTNSSSGTASGTGSAASSTGAASAIEMSGFAFSGVLGMIAYALF